ncbi:MAG: succinyl-diaminopimelate desuccinylase [Gammaproteobacteria bacterium]|nr:succinyl-diaminopimelate desuccinylase [Gammaproteobacteria bacterium]
MTTETIELAEKLIASPSITPEDAGCQDIIADYLTHLGFTVERLPFGDVSNLWARTGTSSPLLVFAGHTDVVPPGPDQEWHTDPFKPVIKDNMLYGRGAADMKGGLAAMLTACKAFLRNAPGFRGSIGFLITSDEEGPARDGTCKVIEVLQERNEKIDYCIVGEPSSMERIGDTIRVGRRGSLSGKLVVQGMQGHVAYPEKADNPIHRAAPVLAELCAMQWDDGNADFPPTSFQVSNYFSGTGANNVIPGTAEISFNFRYSPETTKEALQEQLANLLQKHKLPHQLLWRDSGRPFFTADGELRDAAVNAVRQITGRDPSLSTGGGTSDGRFISPTGAQVIELGPVNATIHKVNECVALDDLDILPQLYRRILELLLTK